MPSPTSPDTERRALALFERLADAPGNTRLRARMTRNEPESVLVRLAALEASVTMAAGAIPTLIPGSADCDNALPPPSHIGAFRLTDRIGRGGMGDVWAGVRDDGLYDQTVAIKLIQRHALRRAASAFEDERRYLARLEHPNIARLIDGGVTTDGLPWLAMEFFDGQPIDLACSALPLAERVQLFIKAADAVQFAHSRMVAHADLKPSNILVDGSGRVKLLDFGIAGLIGTDARAEPGSKPLTRDFASPERVAGDGPSVADDVFSLGKTLSLVIAGLPNEELDAIALKACNSEKEDRYGSAAAMIADLDRWRARLPVAAMHDGWGYRAGKFIERHRRGVLATAVAFAALTASSTVAMSSYFRAERARGQAEQRFDEVRSLSRFMLFDLYDTLSSRAGTVGQRAQIAEKAARYLERLQISADAPADLRLETARSYRRLAAIQGLPGTSNLGLPQRAAQSLTRAANILDGVILQNPRNAGALSERGWTENDRWSLHADNTDTAKTNTEARRFFDAALSVDPDRADAKLGRIVTEKNAGYDLIWEGDKPRDAIVRLRTALASLRSTSWPKAMRDLVLSAEIQLLNRLGDAAYYADDIPGSLKPYREADTIVDRAIEERGAIPALLIQKGENAFNISGSLGDRGGHENEALVVANNGVASLKSLLTFGPDAAAEKKLLVLFGQQAALLEQMGRVRDALGPSSASVALRSARLARSPDDPQRMRDLAIGLAPSAKLLAKAGQHQAACAAATRAVATWAEIRSRGRLGALDGRKNLPNSQALKEKFCRS